MNEHADKFLYVTLGALAVTLVVLLLILGGKAEERLIRESCQNLGKFSIDETAYECRQIRPEAP